MRFILNEGLGRTPLLRIPAGVLGLSMLLSGQLSVAAQTGALAICKDVVAVLPSNLSPRFSVSEQMQGFEIRQCVGGGFQVLAFEHGVRTPVIALEIDTWPRLIYHSFNVLAYQTIGGSSSAVFVLYFRNGRAQPLLAADTRGNAAFTTSDDGAKLIVTIPPDRRVTSPGKTTVFRIPLEAVLAVE